MHKVKIPILYLVLFLILDSEFSPDFLRVWASIFISQDSFSVLFRHSLSGPDFWSYHLEFWRYTDYSRLSAPLSWAISLLTFIEGLSRAAKPRFYYTTNKICSWSLIFQRWYAVRQLYKNKQYACQIASFLFIPSFNPTWYAILLSVRLVVVIYKSCVCHQHIIPWMNYILSTCEIKCIY